MTRPSQHGPALRCLAFSSASAARKIRLSYENIQKHPRFSVAELNTGQYSSYTERGSSSRDKGCRTFREHQSTVVQATRIDPTTAPSYWGGHDRRRRWTSLHDLNVGQRSCPILGAGLLDGKRGETPPCVQPGRRSAPKRSSPLFSDRDSRVHRLADPMGPPAPARTAGPTGPMQPTHRYGRARLLYCPLTLGWGHGCRAGRGPVLGLLQSPLRARRVGIVARFGDGQRATSRRSVPSRDPSGGGGPFG